jgi:hypothetical protein
MSASSASPEDLAKSLLLQSALARKGVSPKTIADILNKLTRSGSIESLARSIQKKLERRCSGSVRVTPRDVMNALALAKILKKVADGAEGVGLKEILARIKDGTLGTLRSGHLNT